MNQTDDIVTYVVPCWKEMKGEGTALNKLSYRTPKALDIPLAGKAETEVLSTASHTIYRTNRFIIAEQIPRWRVWKSSRRFAESCLAACVILLGQEPEYYSGCNSVIQGAFCCTWRLCVISCPFAPALLAAIPVILRDGSCPCLEPSVWDMHILNCINPALYTYIRLLYRKLCSRVHFT